MIPQYSFSSFSWSACNFRFLDETGCQISVSDSPSKDFGRDWNYIHLQGTTRNVDRAKKLIYMRLEQYRATPPWTGQPNNS